MTASVERRPQIHRPDLRTEKELLRSGSVRLAAMDEVGRGALAGPVSVGVVVVTAGIGRVPDGLRDSKLLTPAARVALVPSIRRWVREYAVGHASAQEIDRIGIIAALRLAARRALTALPEPVDAVLLDGNHNYLAEPELALFAADADLPVETLASAPALVRTRIKADLKCAGVAGASVLAKTERDAMLVELDNPHPHYQFAVNKGYGTPEHLAALRAYGPSVVHRRSWRLPSAGMGDDGAVTTEEEEDQ